MLSILQKVFETVKTIIFLEQLSVATECNSRIIYYKILETSRNIYYAKLMV